MEHNKAPVTAEGQDDRRGERRARSLKGAVMRFNKGFSALDAVVRNFSAHGVMLGLGETAGVPSHFDLQIHGEDAARKAEVVWRSFDRIGVRFL